MKVAITAEALCTQHPAGIQRYVRDLAICLAQRPDLRRLECVGPEDLAALLPEGVPTVAHRPLPCGRLASAFVRPPDLSAFDLVHSPAVTSPFFFRPGCPVVMTVHDLTPVLNARWHTWRSRLYFRHVLGRRLRHVDRFIAVSHCTRRDLETVYGVPPDRIDVIHEGVSARFHPGRETRQDFILAVGTLEPRKNLRRLISAYGRLRQRGKISGRLVIAGQPGWGRAVPPVALDGVVFTGYVSEAELLALYQTARVFVYPSLYEGFGLPVLEAMACGCPVICSNTSSLPEVAGDAACRVDPGSTQHLADVLNVVHRDEALRRRMSRDGLAQAATFSWRKAADLTVQTYRKALAYA